MTRPTATNVAIDPPTPSAQNAAGDRGWRRRSAMKVDVAIAKLTVAWLLEYEKLPFGLLRSDKGAFSP
jgi:hypothetical protein